MGCLLESPLGRGLVARRANHVTRGLELSIPCLTFAEGLEV